MRKMAVVGLVVAVAVGCGSSGSSGSSGPSLDGNWLFEGSSSKGLGLTLKSDGTYAELFLELVSNSAADAQVETGTFTATSSSITFTPKQFSCPGPDPVSTYDYTFANGSLVLTTPQGIITLAPNNSAAATMFEITNGCFDADSGAFTAEAIAPVGN